MKTIREFVGRLQRFLFNIRSKRFFRLAVCILIVIVIWIPLAPVAAVLLIVEQPLEKADAIVILSGSASYIDRVDEAVILYKARIASKILLTNDGLQGGWNEYEKRNPYFFERARWELMQKGVPGTSIEVLITPAHGTIGEAQIVIDYALEKKMTSILIVTSPYHTRRALWTYRRIDSRIDKNITIGIKSAFGGRQSPKWYCWWLSLSGWRTIPDEYIKFAYYWIRY